ncbi:putative salicylate hydroxylase protein [Zalerion maritima]|uniref:Salicylate hydroxylase protein n=1 Tax=Zalerion maritima TaxID=339359 RepID=A0AAD5WNX6_9PEZI|nr:putative salicylate hydroxylase protein [Zalerion maritima]
MISTGKYASKAAEASSHAGHGTKSQLGHRQDDKDRKPKKQRRNNQTSLRSDSARSPAHIRETSRRSQRNSAADKRLSKRVRKGSRDSNSQHQVSGSTNAILKDHKATSIVTSVVEEAQDTRQKAKTLSAGALDPSTQSKPEPDVGGGRAQHAPLPPRLKLTALHSGYICISSTGIISADPTIAAIFRELSFPPYVEGFAVSRISATLRHGRPVGMVLLDQPAKSAGRCKPPDPVPSPPRPGSRIRYQIMSREGTSSTTPVAKHKTTTTFGMNARRRERFSPGMRKTNTLPTAGSGVRALVIGAGFAGLAAAIECVRHGHSVLVLESFQGLKALGDIISFGHNAGRIVRKWSDGAVERRLDEICMGDRVPMVMKRYHDGAHLYTQTWEEDLVLYPQGGKKFNGHRAEIHKVVWDYAKSIGIEIRTGCRVREYFEDDDGAGVVVSETGERIKGDVVIAADGVRSTARTIVLGYEDKPKSSGLGPDIHFIAASIKNGKEFNWVCTHRDEHDIKESWSFPGKLSDAQECLKGWDPTLHEIIRATPHDVLVDWKLVYRDPLPNWVSPQKRIVLIGDAAHPFLPTSIQGASQAMEDGVTIAVCLELAGKGKVQEALPVFERMRYERVKAAQKTGETTRDKWHQANFDDPRTDGPSGDESFKLDREMWLLGHDAEAHAYENYGAARDELRNEGGSTL